MKKNIFKYIPLLLVCAFSLALAIPTINNNIKDPGMVLYFNDDEGGHMNLMWYYYSGEKTDGFRWDYDYGLEARYVADFARLVLSRFVAIQPGAFVLILRLLHLAAWILSLAALWYFIGYHFGKGIKQVIAVLLLAVRPSFSYVLTNIKPEPLVLLFMILGLHYMLILIEKPAFRNICLAVIFAALAFIVKFSGLFLLPAIVATMYLSNIYNKKNNADSPGLFPVFKSSWIFPAIVGSAVIGILSSAMMLYRRKSTGLTWFGEYGFFGTLSSNMPMLLVFTAGFILILLSALIFILARSGHVGLRNIVRGINRLNSYTMVVFGVFICAVLIFGFRWVITPGYFISTYSQMAPSASNVAVNMIKDEGLVGSFIGNVFKQIISLDPLVFAMFLLYLGVEISVFVKNIKNPDLGFLKRISLLIFLALPFLYIFSTLRMSGHHMLPFFVVVLILAIEGVFRLASIIKNVRAKILFYSITALILMFDVFMNAEASVRSRIHEYRLQKEDIVFDTISWWRANYPPETVIVSDYPSMLYLPPEYKNVKYFVFYKEGQKKEKLARLIEEYRPRLIYKMTGPDTMPHPSEILPEGRCRIVKIFDNTGRGYQKVPNSRIYVYEVSY